MCVSKRNVLNSFLKDDNDGILRKHFGKIFQSVHPLHEKDVLNKSDLAGGAMALVDPKKH